MITLVVPLVVTGHVAGDRESDWFIDGNDDKGVDKEVEEVNGDLVGAEERAFRMQCLDPRRLFIPPWDVASVITKCNLICYER